ncbi:T-box transcription factor TBX6L-like [Dysidea avara]|uniref:T-box transcription factor TBX6L-like n=1 Tax=Dysidea avara TaxID=196820 RepID=UPI00332F82B1
MTAQAMLESYPSTSEVSLMSSIPTYSSSSCSSSSQDLSIISGECENRRDIASTLSDGGTEVSSGASGSGQTVHVSLQENDLWKQFYLVGNEMILTKAGRRMFPFVVVTPSGLKPRALYTVILHIVCADSFKYKYTDSRWHSINRTDVTHDESRMKYQHPFTPALGEHLNNHPLDFKTMKLTHYSRSKNGDVLLNTMHKYLVEVHIKETYGEECHPQNDVEKASYVFRFPVTTFITVTSYLSPQLTQLKVDHNHFARGFKNRPDEQNLIPTIASSPLPIIFPPPNPHGLPIASLPSFTSLQSFPTAINPAPVNFYPSLTTYYPDPYDYPVHYSVSNEEQQN